MQKFDQLTGLRYFAAVAVFLTHLGISGTGTFISIVKEGYVGVSFFFVLSGFVLSFAYKKAIIDREIKLLNYFLLRLARLSPLHYATMMPYVITRHTFDLKLLAIVAINVLYLQSWFPSSSVYFSLNAPSWSLSNEMFFYVCFFFLISWPVRKLVFFFAALSLAALLSAVMIFNFATDLTIAGASPLKHWAFYIFPGFRMLEFTSGMLIFHAWSAGFKAKSYIFPLSLVLTLVCMGIAPMISEEFRYSLLYLPSISLMIWSSLSLSGRVHRFLSSKALIALGNASFAFYLIHVQILSLLGRDQVLGWMLARGGIFALLYAALALAVISGVSLAVHHAFDEPIGNWLRRAIRRRLKPAE